MMRRSCKLIGITVIIILLLGTAFADAKTVLRFGHTASTNQPIHQASVRFAELVNSRTNGEVQIEIYPASQLGGSRDLIEGVQFGTIDITITGAGALGAFLPAYNWVEYPFIYQDNSHVLKVMTGDIGKELAEELLLRTGTIKVLAQNWLRAARHVFTTNKPIRVASDLNRLPLRVPSGTIFEGFKALGAIPTTIPLSELYMALQQGVVRGAELPIDYIYDNSFYEVAKYMTMTNHVLTTQVMIINDNLWSRLSSEHKEILEDAALEAGELQNSLIENMEKDYEQKLRQLMSVVCLDPEQMEEFAQITQSVVPDLEEKWGEGWYDRIRSAR